MSRDDIQLGEPAEPTLLAAEFPRLRSFGASGWYRAHSDSYPDQADHGCWWFASVAPAGAPEGRFDLPHPEGTCYVANDVEAAVRERLGTTWGRHRFLPPVSLIGTTVSLVDPSRYVQPSDIADTDHEDAAGFVTREISGGAPYGLTHRHAIAFKAGGFAGIAYRPRFTPGNARALALFGEAGRPTPERAASEVPDWQSQLRSPVRSAVSRRRATVITPPKA